MQSDSTGSMMIREERRERLRGMAAGLRNDLIRNTYPLLTDAARKECLTRADRWETEANDV